MSDVATHQESPNSTSRARVVVWSVLLATAGMLWLINSRRPSETRQGGDYASGNGVTLPQAAERWVPTIAPRGSKLRIAVLLVLGRWSIHYRWMYPMSFHNHKAYADKWGYDFIVVDESLSMVGRSAMWTKLVAVREFLPYYDWVFYSDIDTLFTNFDVRLEDHVLDDKYDIIQTKDVRSLNTGVFAMKYSDISKQFLEDIFLVPERFWRKIHEQAAWIPLVVHRKKYKAHLKVLPQKAMNSYDKRMWPKDGPTSDYEDGDFMVHCPGCYWTDLARCKMVFSEHFNNTQARFVPREQWFDPMNTSQVLSTPGTYLPKLLRNFKMTFAPEVKAPDMVWPWGQDSNEI